MKYFFTTLAINEPYFKKTLDFFTSLHEKTNNGLFNITTTKEDLQNLSEHTGMSLDEFKEKYPKIFIKTLDDFNFKIQYGLDMEGNGFIFNLNLKVLAIKSVLTLNKDFDFLIYTDGDWGVYDGFEEGKLFQMFEFMNNNDVDFGFERPAKIGNYKKNNYHDCFFYEKILDYQVDKHDLWDEAEVVNEQFLVFKNNNKLILFEQKWEQMLWYTIANNIRNYPDGFEIGVAALESRMKHSFHPPKLLQNCFFFYPKYSDYKHIRF